jgi:hypothetical protein
VGLQKRLKATGKRQEGAKKLACRSRKNRWLAKTTPWSCRHQQVLALRLWSSWQLVALSAGICSLSEKAIGNTRAQDTTSELHPNPKPKNQEAKKAKEAKEAIVCCILLQHCCVVVYSV